jgi:hypothetical protein
MTWLEGEDFRTRIGTPPAQVAREALGILDRDGWCKWMTTVRPGAIITAEGALVSFPEGSHCLGGAMNLILTGCAEQWCENAAAYDAAVGVIKEQYPLKWDDLDDLPSVGIITFFNDLEDTAEEDVRRILEKLAAG